MPVDTYQPIQVLKPVADEVWLIDGPVVHMAYGPVRLPFPTRAVVVRLPSGELWVHSPTVGPPERLVAQLEALGPVRHLVSPNAIHYAGIPTWQARFPQALAWASPGVRDRSRSQGVEVRFDHDLDDAPPAAWAKAIDQLVFRGSRLLEEVVFFHRPSRTLLLTDLIENFEAHKVHGFWLRAAMRVARVMDPDGQVPRDLRATYLGHKDQARACFERVRAWQPERILLAHGRCYERDAMKELDRAFRWLG